MTGALGVPPTKSKEGPVALFETPPRVGPKTPANTKPTKVGRWGWRGRSPLPGGLGDVPPKFSKKGKVAHSYNFGPF
jgi:hypothetical protein